MALEWLIDLMKEWVLAQGFLTTSYIDRGDHDYADYDENDLTIDGAEHDIDMSEFIGDGATAVNFHTVGISTNIADVFYLRPKSHPRLFGSCTIRPQIANHSIGERRAVGCDPDKIFTYKFVGVGWTQLKINVKGWWL